ncbi:MAG TPA: hypothetical protein VIL89_09645 [Clostridia bacterium]
MQKNAAAGENGIYSSGDSFVGINREISKGGYEIDLVLTANIQPFKGQADYHLISQ